MSFRSWLSKPFHRRGNWRSLTIFDGGQGCFQIFGGRRRGITQQDIGTWVLYLPEQVRKNLLHLFGGLSPGVVTLVGPEASELTFFDLPQHSRDELQRLALAVRADAEESVEQVPGQTKVGPSDDRGRLGPEEVDLRDGTSRQRVLLLVNLDISVGASASLPSRKVTA